MIIGGGGGCWGSIISYCLTQLEANCIIFFCQREKIVNNNYVTILCLQTRSYSDLQNFIYILNFFSAHLNKVGTDIDMSIREEEERRDLTPS